MSDPVVWYHISGPADENRELPNHRMGSNPGWCDECAGPYPPPVLERA